jgi:hypothetical protein
MSPILWTQFHQPHAKSIKNTLFHDFFDEVLRQRIIMNSATKPRYGALFSSVFANRAGCKKTIGC